MKLYENFECGKEQILTVGMKQGTRQNTSWFGGQAAKFSQLEHLRQGPSNATGSSVEPQLLQAEIRVQSASQSEVSQTGSSAHLKSGRYAHAIEPGSHPSFIRPETQCADFCELPHVQPFSS